jgi:hypothetical protein
MPDNRKSVQSPPLDGDLDEAQDQFFSIINKKQHLSRRNILMQKPQTLVTYQSDK